jgi:hypothetical protein
MSYRSMENTIRQIMANSSRPAWTAVAANINEENIGGRTYNNMHLCKTAVDKFEDDLKNKDNDTQIHKALAVVNDYLGVEARVLDKGHATEDDVKAVKAGVEKAKQAISAAGLTGHDYHGLHIRAVERKLKKEEQYVAESHYEVGDDVMYKGQEAEVVAIDEPQTGKYYTIELEDGKKVKAGADELSPEEDDDDEEEMEEQAGMYNYMDTSDTGGAEEVRMAKRQLHFISYAAQELIEYVDAVGDMDEWFQNKMTTAHEMIKGLHAYMAGDMRARGMATESVKLDEKSVSQAQQKAAGAALAAKRGEIKPSELQGASKQMYDSMTTKELDDFASTKHKGLPNKVDENRYSPLQMAKAKKEREDKRKKDGDSYYQRLTKKQYGGMMGGLKKEEVEIDEKTRPFPFQGSNDHAPKNIFQPPLGSRKTMGQVSFLDKDGKEYSPTSFKNKKKMKENEELGEASKAPFKTPEENKAYQAGQRAWRDKKKFDQNPNKDLKLKQAWSRGHNDAGAKFTKRYGSNETKARMESVELGEAQHKVPSKSSKSSGDALMDYAKKSGGIDKASLMKLAGKLQNHSATGNPSTMANIVKSVKGMDTEPRDEAMKIIQKHDPAMYRSIVSKAKLSESVKLGEGFFDKLKSAPHVAKAGVAANKGDLEAVKGHVSNAVPKHITGDDREKQMKKHYASISKATKNTSMKTVLKKMSESAELDEANVKKGDAVKIINAKKYDALSKPEVSGIVIGMLGSKVMVKVGSGQMNVDPKDLVKESAELGEATDFRPGDTVHEVGSKLKGTVQHKGNRDLIAVKFGSVNKMIPASKLRLAEEVDLDETKGAPKGFHFTRDGKLKRGDADVDGPGGSKLRSDPLDKTRSKIPAVSEAITPKHVKMAIGVASDKRYAGGDMTGAVRAIEKIKKGLSDHPQVKAVLRRQNESQLAITRRADVGVEKTRTPDGKFIFKKKPKKEIAVEQYDRYSSVLSRAIKKKS